MHIIRLVKCKNNIFRFNEYNKKLKYNVSMIIHFHNISGFIKQNKTYLETTVKKLLHFFIRVF